MASVRNGQIVDELEIFSDIVKALKEIRTRKNKCLINVLK